MEFSPKGSGGPFRVCMGMYAVADLGGTPPAPPPPPPPPPVQPDNFISLLGHTPTTCY